jgi:hypothetical protein
MKHGIAWADLMQLRFPKNVQTILKYVAGNGVVAVTK